MTLGRPGGIGAYLTGPNLPRTLPGESEHRMNFLRACMCVCVRAQCGSTSRWADVTHSGLYAIFGRILEANFDSGKADTAGYMKQLEMWKSEVPAHLALLLDANLTPLWDPTPYEAPCIVLTFRFLMVRMLAYRPLIAQALDVCRPRAIVGNGTITPSIDYNTCLAGLAICTQDAIRIIALGTVLASRQQWPKGGSAWYRLYYSKLCYRRDRKC